MGGIHRRSLQRGLDHSFDFFTAQSPFAARPLSIPDQARHSELLKAAPPEQHGRTRSAQLPSNRMVRQPFAGSQHDASSQADFLPGFVRTEQLLKPLFLTSIYREGGDGLEHNHSMAN